MTALCAFLAKIWLEVPKGYMINFYEYIKQSGNKENTEEKLFLFERLNNNRSRTKLLRD
jgi:hypothetical protein